MPQVTRSVNKCSRCGHEWMSRGDAVRCAKCKSPYWDVERGLPEKQAAVAGKVFLKKSTTIPEPTLTPEVVVGPEVNYSRPAHHPTCKCGVCKPIGVVVTSGKRGKEIEVAVGGPCKHGARLGFCKKGCK